MNMIDLAVDTNVLIYGKPKKKQPCRRWCRRVLDAIVNDKCVFLALNRHVMAEYDQKLGKANPALYWLKQVYVSKKYREYNGRSLTRQLRLALLAAGCPNNDHKFVVMAMVTVSKRIVSEDRHFTNDRVRKLLKRKVDVTATTAEETCADLGWN